MHPILAESRALALYLFVFLLIGCALAAILASTGNVPWAASVTFCIPMALVYGLMSLSSWYLCRTLPLNTTALTRVFGIFFTASVVSAALWIVVGEVLASLLSNISVMESMQDRYNAQLILFSAVGVGLFLLSVAVHYIIITFEQTQESERRSLELKILAQTAELRALQSQINPHFLFNSLNSISALVTKDPVAARSMTQMLADFLRQTLKVGTADAISLADELSFCKRYLDIEQVRHGSRLRFEQEISAEAASMAIPPLLLQPLIENAVTHGIAHLIEGGTILVKAERHGESLTITVQNPCDPDRPKTRGNRMGLENIRKRLLTLSSSETRLDVKEHSGIFTATLILPAVRP